MNGNPARETWETLQSGVHLPRRPTGIWPWAGPELSIQPRAANDAVQSAPHANAAAGRSATVRLFMENMPWAVWIGLAQTTLLATALWGLVPLSALLTWYAFALAQSGVRVGMYLRYVRDPLPDPEKWTQRLVALAGANGLIWGVFGLVFATLVPVPYQLLILIVLTCIAAESALSAVMILPNIFVVFVVTALLPVVAYSFLGTPVQQAAAFSILLAITLQMRFSHRHRHLLESRAGLEAQRQQLQDELEKKKQAEMHFLRTRTMLLGAMGHDLMHPVHGMRLMVEGLRDKPHSQPAIADALQIGLDSLNRQLTAILNSVRLDPGTYRPEILSMPIQALIERVVADNASSARANGASLLGANTTAWVSADPLLLHSILDNLVHNAICHAKRGRVLVGARHCGATTRIEIWDSGVGIAQADLANIWRDGYRVADTEAGHGMGLALVKDMAELMGVGISVRSTLGKGSRFSLCLPAATPPATGGA